MSITKYVDFSNNNTYVINHNSINIGIIKEIEIDTNIDIVPIYDIYDPLEPVPEPISNNKPTATQSPIYATYYLLDKDEREVFIQTGDIALALGFHFQSLN